MKSLVVQVHDVESRTVLSVRVEGQHLWLALLDTLLLVHALLQTLKHTLLTDTLYVPPGKKDRKKGHTRKRVSDKRQK